MFRIYPDARYIDGAGVFSALVVLAQNCNGDPHVLDAIIRLAFVYGVASVPGIEQDAARALALDKIMADSLSNRDRIIHNTGLGR